MKRVVVLLVCVIPFEPALAAQEDRGMRDEARRIVSRHRTVFTHPPRRIPSRTQTDAPLLGNGDMAVALGGPPEAQRLWLCKNDFWRLKSKYNASGPRVFGGIDVNIPDLKGADYRVEQSLCEAVTQAEFTKHDLTVKMRAWVAATENVVVVRLSAAGKTADVSVSLAPARGAALRDQPGVKELPKQVRAHAE